MTRYHAAVMASDPHAEYLALAQLLRCRLITLDARLHRSTAPLGFVIAPDDL